MAQDKLWQAAIYDYNDSRFQWTVKAIEDQNPSPTVLTSWGYIKNAKCTLCSEYNCSLKHILNQCPKALQQNRYTWRHDSILLSIYTKIREVVNRGRARFKQGTSISQRPTTGCKFVKGETVEPSKPSAQPAVAKKCKTCGSGLTPCLCPTRADRRMGKLAKQRVKRPPVPPSPDITPDVLPAVAANSQVKTIDYTPNYAQWNQQTNLTRQKQQHPSPGTTPVAPLPAVPAAATKYEVGRLESSDDWTIQFDLNVPEDNQSKHQPFPPHIASIAKRPDGLVFSDKLKTLICIELTAPWEENMKKSHDAKFEKYRKEGIHRIEGWTIIPICVEVGSRGFINFSWQNMSSAVGLTKTESKTLRKRAAIIARRCSYNL